MSVLPETIIDTSQYKGTQFNSTTNDRDKIILSSFYIHYSTIYRVVILGTLLTGN